MLDSARRPDQRTDPAPAASRDTPREVGGLALRLSTALPSEGIIRRKCSCGGTGGPCPECQEEQE